MLCVLVPQDKRLVPGAGATEIELAKHLTSYGEVDGIYCTLIPDSVIAAFSHQGDKHDLVFV